MTTKKIFWLSIALLAVGAAYAWWSDRFAGFHDDPQVAAVQRALRAVEKADPEDEAEAVRGMREKSQELTPEQRMQVMEPAMRAMMDAEVERLRRFFAQPEADQIKQIDEEIDRLDAARRQNSNNPADQRHKKLQVQQRPRKSNAARQAHVDRTTAPFRALTLEYHKKFVGRMKQRRLMD